MVRPVDAALLGVLLASTAASASLHEVPGEFPTIQAAIYAALPGDTIRVAPGDYTGGGNRDLHTDGKDLVIASAGGSGVTRLDCQGSESMPHRAFRFDSGEGPACRVEGFTILNGWQWNGGAFYCEGSSPTIVDCVVSGSRAGMEGGAIYLRGGCAPLIARCTFRSNVALSLMIGGGTGGVLMCNASSPVVEDCTFVDNDAASCGGAIYFFALSGGALSRDQFLVNTAATAGAIILDNSSPSLTDCLFEDNQVAGGIAGAVFCKSGCQSVFTRCQFLRSRSWWAGAGVYCSSGSNPTFAECLFAENRVDGDGGGGGLFVTTAPVLRDCVFRQNYASDGAGMACSEGAAPVLTRCSFIENHARNWAYGWGGAVSAWAGTTPSFTECVFLGNTALSEGGGVFCGRANPAFTNCTFARNDAPAGGGLYARDGASPVLRRTIVAFNAAGGGIGCRDDAGPITLECTDIFGNTGGDWTEPCIQAAYGVLGNFAADPLFCDLAEGDVSLNGQSPCLPGHHPGGEDCGLIGARSCGCGDPSAARPVTWGQLKHGLRRP